MSVYNNAIITLRSLYVELILQQEAGWSHWISKAEENLVVLKIDNSSLHQNIKVHKTINNLDTYS